MDQEELKKPTPALSLMQRLDQLDRLLQVLEEKHCLSERHPSSHMIESAEVEPQEKCKTISSALEEVHHKGTLMDRVAFLEDRALQLTLEIDVNTSKSGSSVVTIHEKFENGPESAITDKLHEDPTTIPQGKPNADLTQGYALCQEYRELQNHGFITCPQDGLVAWRDRSHKVKCLQRCQVA